MKILALILLPLLMWSSYTGTRRVYLFGMFREDVPADVKILRQLDLFSMITYYIYMICAFWWFKWYIVAATFLVSELVGAVMRNSGAFTYFARGRYRGYTLIAIQTAILIAYPVILWS